MTNKLTVKQNLDNARKIAHATMIKNGHYKRMAKKRWSNYRKLSTGKVA